MESTHNEVRENTIIVGKQPKAMYCARVVPLSNHLLSIRRVWRSRKEKSERPWRGHMPGCPDVHDLPLFRHSQRFLASIDKTCFRKQSMWLDMHVPR